MTRRLAPAVAGLLALAAIPVALAQGKSVFTESTVHPMGAPVAEAPAPVARDYRAVTRGHTPRTHAHEVADVFAQACLSSRGDPIAATDWALNQGLDPKPFDAPWGKDGMPQTGTAFRRHVDAGDSLMVFVGHNPATCSVLTMQRADGAQLRERLAQFVAAWVAPAAPPPPAGRTPLAAGGELLGYKFADGGQMVTFGVTTQKGAGASILALTIADAPPR